MKLTIALKWEVLYSPGYKGLGYGRFIEILRWGARAIGLIWAYHTSFCLLVIWCIPIKSWIFFLTLWFWLCSSLEGGWGVGWDVYLSYSVWLSTGRSTLLEELEKGPLVMIWKYQFSKTYILLLLLTFSDFYRSYIKRGRKKPAFCAILLPSYQSCPGHLAHTHPDFSCSSILCVLPVTWAPQWF